jgi:hypothetical protein
MHQTHKLFPVGHDHVRNEDTPMDFARLSEEWLRALRGRRSQRATSKRLGYGSNVVYRWETGRAAPPASSAFSAAKNYGVDLHAACATFLRLPKESAAHFTLDTPSGIGLLLETLRGKRTFVELATHTVANRFTLARWFRGTGEPSFPELLELVELLTGRLLDFVAAFVDPLKLPCLAQRWRSHVALREAAFDAPWSHAVLRCLELDDYAALPRHQPGWIARRIGIPKDEEERCLKLLERSGQIESKHERWAPVARATVDLGADPERSRALRRFWLEQALDRFDRRFRGAYGYNLFAIAEADYARLTRLYTEYFAAMRKVVAESRKGDRMVLFSGQLIVLDDARARGS